MKTIIAAVLLLAVPGLSHAAKAEKLNKDYVWLPKKELGGWKVMAHDEMVNSVSRKSCRVENDTYYPGAGGKTTFSCPYAELIAEEHAGGLRGNTVRLGCGKTNAYNAGPKKADGPADKSSSFQSADADKNAAKMKQMEAQIDAMPPQAQAMMRQQLAAMKQNAARGQASDARNKEAKVAEAKEEMTQERCMAAWNKFLENFRAD